MQGKLLEELTCPITYELFEDPISVPCCGKTFSRKALCDALRNQINHRNSCPLCNGDLSAYDANTAPSNKNILSFLELVKHQQQMQQQLEQLDNLSEQKQNVVARFAPQAPKEAPKQEWTASIKTMYNDDMDTKHTKSRIAQLQITLKNSTFELMPSLFIIVVDKSGSMSGDPWKQVVTALMHISAITDSNSLIKTCFIVYDSTARIIDNYSQIQSIRAGGGTNFSAAFDRIKEILIKYLPECNHNTLHKNVTIAFLTDGRDNCSKNKNKLAANFKQMLSDYWVQRSSCITVHTIGFGGSCDKTFLEELRSENGAFRYAEPSDLDDMLCTKLKTLFDKISEFATVAIRLDLKRCHKYFRFCNQTSHNSGDNDDEKRMGDDTIAIQFPVGSDHCGVFKQWIEWRDDQDMDDNMCICIKSVADKDKIIQIQINDEHAQNKESNMELFSQWILRLTDELATQIYHLSNKHYKEYDERTFDLHCALIQQNCIALQEILTVDYKAFISLQDKIEYLLNSIVSLRDGLSINMGKISDLRFGSQFESGSHQATSNKHCDRMEQLEEKYRQIRLLDEDDEERKQKAEVLHKYAFDNLHQDRNKLQEMLMNMLNDKEIIEYLTSDQVTEKDILHCDINGNNALHICCYVGKFNVVREILAQYHAVIDIQQQNHDEETALTLAIKKRGYYHTIRTLLKYSAKIDPERSEALEQFAMDLNYIITAKLIRDLRTNSSDPNKHMSSEYLVYLYEDAMSNNKEIDAQKYLELFLLHKTEKYVRLMLNKHKAVADIDMLLKYCIPPKADHPETEQYLNLCKLLLQKDKSLIDQRNKASETALFRAAERGSLAHCEYFISKGAAIDAQNDLGNTPLWVSTAKLYPCIMKYLISKGADVNHKNLKGNPPLYNLCIRGKEKAVNILLSTKKVQIENMMNTNGDTLILICCRNKNFRILPLLLNYVSLEFANFKAHIDGFNAIFSSVETESVECIKILHQFGVDLNQKTEDDNDILPGATPLHLACFYKRYEAAKVLISLGADVNAVDNIHKQIPLSLAVIQLNHKIIQLLARKSNIILKDKYGNTPLSYCQNHVEIRKLLIDPLLDILCDLCCGKFDEEHTQIALNIVTQYCGLKSCFNTKDALNITDSDGMTPLSYAVINKKYNACKTLLSLNADPSIKNKYGVNCFVFNEWIPNIKIKQLLLPYYQKLSQMEKNNVKHSVDRLQKMNALSWFNSFTLDLNRLSLNTFHILTYSAMDQRMQNFIENVTIQMSVITTHKIETNRSLLSTLNKLDCNSIIAKYDESAVERVFKYKYGSADRVFDENQYLNIILNSKLFTINFVAGYEEKTEDEDESRTEAKDVFLLSLYTNNDILCNVINYELSDGDNDKPNMNILHSIKLITNILSQLPSFIGEAFIGCNKRIDRTLFLLNTEFSWNAMISGSTQWRMAIYHLHDFTTKKNEGTVFLIKSKTGKHIGRYSQFAFESEIIFAHSTRFRVSAWYKGDVICLAQQNIRKNTFGIEIKEELNKYMTSNKSLIIELEECDN